MSSTGQARRRYDASGRRRQAQQNRDQVLAVARRLFVERGYPATSIAQIAAAAGVSDRTVFAAFESKANLLKTVLDTAIAGDSEQVPLHQRATMRGVHEASTMQEAVERLADAFAEVVDRVYDVYTVLHGAAAVDPEIARLERDLATQRLSGVEQLAATFANRLGIDDDPDAIAYLRDSLWVLGAPQQYGLMRERGWSVDRYRDWIARALAAMVPPPR
jgi:AcrR family transcriptional regulator